MYSSARVTFISSACECSMASSSTPQSDSDVRVCEVCERTLRASQYYDHLRRKKHLKRLAERQRSQNDIALYNDAVLQYMYSLYNRAAVRWVVYVSRASVQALSAEAIL